MELGNAIFGNSRGEKPIPRTDEWASPLYALLERSGCDDYGCPGFENETFKIMSYDWDAECDCGADEKMVTWLDANDHAPECYQSVTEAEIARYDIESGYAKLDEAMYGSPIKEHTEEVDPGITVHIFEPRRDALAEKWRVANEKRTAFVDGVRKRACKERGLSYPRGCAVHCDCGRDKRSDVFWLEIGGHAETCRVIQPNFLFKPTGFRVSWYKYPLRDSYMSPGVTNAEWCMILAACEASLVRAT